MQKLIVANWKMYLGLRESVALAKKVVKDTSRLGSKNNDVDIVLCPSFVALEEVGKIVHGTRIKLGAQDVEPEKRGAYTGEVGLDDLGEIGVHYVLVGHPERRRMFQETDVTVNKKLRAVLDAGMKPVLCVGEPWEVRRLGLEKVQRYVGKQVRAGLRGVSKQDLAHVVVAYEPVWAIGTGRPDTPEDASAMHGWIWRAAVGIFGDRISVATEIRSPRIQILYGGSVNAKNAVKFLQAPAVDGLLIGRASTQAAEFRKIISSL